MPKPDNSISPAREAGDLNWFKYASPQTFFPLAGKAIPLCAVAALLLCAAGFYIGFFVAPTDAQQHDAYRIIYLHVPAAWMSMVIYLAMAWWAGIGLVMNTRLSSMMASALAPTGAMFTFLALWTGALWGRPTWGAWWVWDARLTSELILLFLYIGFMALQASIDEPRRADKAGAVLALVGVVNIPIIYFSVQWWNTLHQGSSINFSNGSSMAPVMAAGMLTMTLGFWAYTFAVALSRLRCIVLERERHTEWVKEYQGERGMIWDSWGDFFAMGGYALYVWGSILVVAGCMLGEMLSLGMRRRSILLQLKSRSGTQRDRT